MATLNPKPGSSSKKQHQVLVIAGRRQGLELPEIRKLVGGSITKLSAADCSKWIEHFSGKGLANPPGKAPGPYGKKRSDAARMITDSHIRQIARLGMDYFQGLPAFRAWLSKNFEVPNCRTPWAPDLVDLIRQLGTAERAGQVIRVLKEMIDRREAKQKAATV